MDPLASDRRLVEWESDLALKLAALHPGDGWSVRCFEQACSTMDSARRLLSEIGEGAPLLVLAERQYAGRGRRGRRWEPAGRGLYMTAAFAAEGAREKLSAFSLVAGCVVHGYLAMLGCPAGLKWPNDVCARDRKKLAGILIEQVNQAERPYLLTGIGVNLKDAPAGVGAAAVFDLCGREPSAVAAAAAIAADLLAAWHVFAREGFAAVRERWLARALFTDFMLPFEVAAVILTVAVIAAVMLTLRRRPGARHQDPSAQARVRAADRLRMVRMPAEVPPAKPAGEGEGA